MIDGPRINVSCDPFFTPMSASLALLVSCEWPCKIRACAPGARIPVSRIIASNSIQRQLGFAFTNVSSWPPSDRTAILICTLDGVGMTHSPCSGLHSSAVQSFEAVRMCDVGSCLSTAKFVPDKQQRSCKVMRASNMVCEQLWQGMSQNH